MKVLHINANYLTTALHQTMIRKLSTLGIENQVFVATYNKENKVIDPDENVTVAECFHKCDRFLFDYKQKKIIDALIANFDVKEFNVVHAYTLFTDGNVAWNLKQSYGTPYVVAVRNTDVNVFFKYMLNLRKRGVDILRGASAVFFLSQTYKNEVLNKYIPHKFKEEIEAKTYVIPNGIDDFWVKNSQYHGKVDNTKHMIYAGVINRNKNIETTQKALTILRKKGYDIDFCIVGSIKDRSVYAKVVAYEGTEYVPAKPKEELISLYRKSDIFIMPSFTETFGLVYAEAMSQGLPVIYTRGQGFDGQFKEGEVGYSVDPNSPEEVAQAVEKILESYSEMSKKCVEYMGRFCWDSICRIYIKVYKSV